MERGRDQFRKYSKLIHLLTKYYSLYSKKTLNIKLIKNRDTPGKIGLAKRYCILKNIANKIGENVSIQQNVYIFNADKLEIGDNVSIHPMAYIEAYGTIKIGNDVSIAEGATLMSVSHVYDREDIPIKDQGLIKQPIIIQDNVWIGAKATILGGNTIGRGVIIGAGAVVTKSVEENQIAAGVPARTIKMRLKK